MFHPGVDSQHACRQRRFTMVFVAAVNGLRPRSACWLDTAWWGGGELVVVGRRSSCGKERLPLGMQTAMESIRIDVVEIEVGPAVSLLQFSSPARHILLAMFLMICDPGVTSRIRWLDSHT